jgi:two-component system LytT family response regulator
MEVEKISVMIVDDEAPAREKLRRYVGSNPQFNVIAEAVNGQEALDKISCFKPQLLLLDIQMPGMTGFDVLRLMDAHSLPVIFTTAYDEYAVQAFEVSAVDYLLKPINKERLQQAMDKVSLLMQQDWGEKISSVLQHLKQKNFINRLAVRQGQRTKIINVQDIIFIRSEHRLVNIYAQNGERYWTNENLSQLESRLNPLDFMRIHRSTIINLAANFEIESWNSGRLKLHFENDNAVVASRDHVIKLRKSLEL